jgi:transcriptional regulator with XRE-family HTH domain
MDSAGWNPAMLARRSGLTKQTISQILAGESVQPTAWQVARIAGAFKVDPNTVFSAIGLWDNVSGRSPVPAEVATAYARMPAFGQAVFARIGHVLSEELEPYAALESRDETQSLGQQGNEERPADLSSIGEEKPGIQSPASIHEAQLQDAGELGPAGDEDPDAPLDITEEQLRQGINRGAMAAEPSDLPFDVEHDEYERGEQP